MSAQVVCPHCGKSIKLRDRSLLGKKGKCPGCAKSFLIQEHAPAEEIIPLQLADDEPAVGTGARWVPDDPVMPDATAPVAYVPIQTPQGVVLAPVLSGPPSGYPPGVVGPGVASAPPLIPPSPAPSTGLPGFDFGLGGETQPAAITPVAEVRFRPNSTRRKKNQSSVWIAVALVSVLVGGAVFYLNSQSAPGTVAQPVPASPANTLADAAEALTPPGAYSRESLMADPALVAEFKPTKGEPIPLNMLTGTNNVLIHLRPDRIWGQERSAAELKASLTEDVVTWLETTIQRMTRRRPDQIEELVIGMSVLSKVEPPQISTVFRLKSPEKRSALVLEFNGAPISAEGKPLVTSKDGYAFHVKDDRTIAICSAGMGGDLSDAAAQPLECVTDGIQLLLKASDRERSFTVFVDATDAITYSSQLFEPSAEAAFVKVLEWFGPEAETISWSVNLGSTLHSEIRVRPKGARSGTGKISTAETLKDDYAKRLPSLVEGDLMGAVRLMRPTRSGFRQIIGRFPAMVEAFRQATIFQLGSNQYLTMTTVLPTKAAPNLALGTVLTWDESTRTNFNSSVTETAVADAGQDLPKTVMERLKTEFEIEFSRKPLADAFAYLGEETKVNFVVDGDALKMAGYTKNMPQTFSLGKAPATKGILTIITWPMQEKLCLVVDDAKMEAKITTLADAESKGLKAVPIDSLK